MVTIILLVCLWQTVVSGIKDWYVQRGTRAVIEWNLAQSISNEICSVKKNMNWTLFNIVFGKVQRNTDDEMVQYHGSDVSTFFHFTIVNVSKIDEGLYSLVRNLDDTSIGDIQLIVIDTPVTKAPSSDVSSTGYITAVVIAICAVVVLLIVVLLYVFNRRIWASANKGKISKGAGLKYCQPSVNFSSKTRNSYETVPTENEIETQHCNKTEIRSHDSQQLEKNSSKELTYIEVTFDEQKKANDQSKPKILGEPERSNYAEVDFSINANQEFPTENEIETQHCNKTEIRSHDSQQLEKNSSKELTYIEVTFDEQKKADDQSRPKILGETERSNYAEVDFSINANRESDRSDKQVMVEESDDEEVCYHTS